MAKNWKASEAIQAIKENNRADIMDIGKRFPLFLHLATQVNEAAVELFSCLPEYVTARKLESMLKGEIEEQEETEEEVEVELVEEKPAKKAPAKKAEAVEEDTKTAKDLYTECIEAGLKVKPKLSKEAYAKALAAAAATPDAEEGWDEEEKPAKKATAKKAPAKKAEAEAEDDEWDI